MEDRSCGQFQGPKPWEAYHVTGEFSKLGKGYVNHCGPTSITNLILSLRQQENSQICSQEEAVRVFEEVAAIGKRHVLYVNVDLLKVWGGTLDLGAGRFIALCLKKIGIPIARVKRRRFCSRKNLEAALSRGSILYIIMRHHKKYKNHHILCYGLEDGRLRVADNWSRTPQYLTFEEVKWYFFIEVELRRVDTPEQETSPLVFSR